MTFDASTHKNILVRILKDIFSNSAIGPYLGFKGGTAVLLFYNLSRFSVDLDFDLLDESKESIVFVIFLMFGFFFTITGPSMKRSWNIEQKIPSKNSLKCVLMI